jgi:hypothetical protein
MLSFQGHFPPTFSLQRLTDLYRERLSTSHKHRWLTPDMKNIANPIWQYCRFHLRQLRA